MAVVLILASLLIGAAAAYLAWPLGLLWIAILVPAVTSLSVLIGAVLMAYGQSRQAEAQTPFSQAFQQVLTRLNLR
jgi:hypothetical protein